MAGSGSLTSGSLTRRRIKRRKTCSQTIEHFVLWLRHLYRTHPRTHAQWEVSWCAQERHTARFEVCWPKQKGLGGIIIFLDKKGKFKTIYFPNSEKKCNAPLFKVSQPLREFADWFVYHLQVSLCCWVVKLWPQTCRVRSCLAFWPYAICKIYYFEKKNARQKFSLQKFKCLRFPRYDSKFEKKTKKQRRKLEVIICTVACLTFFANPSSDRRAAMNTRGQGAGPSRPDETQRDEPDNGAMVATAIAKVVVRNCEI